MYVIIGTIKVKPEYLDAFVENVRRHAAASAQEPGCVRYDVLQDAADPTIICLYEVFRSEADLDVHRQQDYYKQWMSLSREWRDSSSYSRRVLRNLFPDDAAWDVRS